MRNEQLMPERAAITFMRNQKSERDAQGEGREKQKASFTRTARQITDNIAHEFSRNAIDQTAPTITPTPAPKQAEPIVKQFKEIAKDTSKPEQTKEQIAKAFKQNKQDKTLNEQQRVRLALKHERERQSQQPDIERDMGMEYD